MNALHEAAQQALELLYRAREHFSVYTEGDWFQLERDCQSAITALRAALAQQDAPDHETRAELAEQQVVQLAEERDHYRNLWQKAQQDEPVKHQHKWFRTGAMEPGQMRCIDCGKWGKEQAEPVEPGAWVASKDGRVIYDDASKDDSLLRVSGDFENDEQRISYAKQIVDKLNAAPPQRTMVPLTEEEILAAVGWERAEMYMKLATNFPVDEAKQETLKNARAIERAHGIKE